MIGHEELLHGLKQERRWAVDNVTADVLPEHIDRLANLHTAILALEAVMAEPRQAKTGPKIEFGEDGYPK
ncbi:MAG: hypothetical protein EOS07_35550 [Mesorhizobium sp.]|nr:MAG: hypothetical protein EOS07_35550 [Mesorhizobium sp.]